MARRGNKKSKQGGASQRKREPKIVEEVNDSDDEEIPEDEAFNSEDERLFGHFFQDQDDEKKRKRPSGLDSSEDEDVTSDEDGDSSDSDSDDEEADEEDDGQYMLELLNKLDSVNDSNDSKKLSVAQMGKIPESDYSNSISKNGLTLDNLMEGIQDTQGFRDLQKTFAKQQVATPAPLDNVVANRVQRKMAYEARAKDISRWVKAVQENRQAETLDFKPKERVELTRDALVDKFEAKTDFEKEIEQALEDAGQKDEEAVLKAEEEALQDDLGANRLTMEEYKKRRGQLAQIRALMFYHEQKRHHMKKIKSKKYRKIRKKQRERLKESELEAAMEEDEDLAKEMKEKEEVARIQERMTLAHKNTSKWAKRILKRGKNVDVDTRRALSAQLKRGDDLRRKMMGDQLSDSEDNGSDEEDLVEAARKVLQETEDGPDPTQGKTGLFKLSFMQKGIQKQRDQAKEEARRLLGELLSNEMDDYDQAVQSDDEKGKSKPKPPAASEKEMKSILQQGELVASSLEFGNSNTMTTSGGIDIDIGADKDGNDDSEEDASEDNGKNEQEKQAGSSSEPSDFVATLQVSKRPAGTKADNTSTKKADNKKPKASVSPSKKQSQPLESDEVNPWIQSVDANSKKMVSNEASVSKPSNKAKRIGTVDVAGAIDLFDAGTTKDETGVDTKNASGKAGDSKEEKLITSLTQEELVRRAFVGQDEKEIDEDFQKEKEAMVAESDPTRKVKQEKNSDEVSGWGSWAGKGAPPPKARKLPKKLQAPKKKEEKRKRLDDAKPGVIINQKRLKKTANNFMLSDVPHPYATRAEYEQAMLGGVGKEWNVSGSFKSMTRPEILTRAGKIIQPISKKAKQARPAAKF
jgi:U3 small nucleolar RNA-associated protein 14